MPVCSSWIHVPVCQLSVEVEEGMGSLWWAGVTGSCELPRTKLGIYLESSSGAVTVLSYEAMSPPLIAHILIFLVHKSSSLSPYEAQTSLPNMWLELCSSLGQRDE